MADAGPFVFRRQRLADTIARALVDTHVAWQVCGGPHRIEQPVAGHTTAARVHLYVTCRGQRHFIGQLAPGDDA